MGQDGHRAKLEEISDYIRVWVGGPVLTRNTPVMKPWAAIEVISSGGATSPLWLCGAGILVCICAVVSTGEQEGPVWLG